ncbi:MAG: hypothetical protein ACKVQB_01770 [Bacteroidia bacterium]
MKKNICTLLIMLLGLSNVMAQINDKTTCLNNLSAASSLYEKAQFTEAIALIEPCLKSGALNGNLPDAYRILGLCYHQMGDEPKRNDAILKLLKKNLKYQLFPLNDPKDFTNVVNSFKIESKLFIGVKTGFNYSIPNVTGAYSVKPATLETVTERGQFLGLNVDYFLKKKTLSINGWVSSSSISFTQNVTFNDVEKINYKEDLNLWDMGLEVKYYPLKKGKIIPYVGVGLNNLMVRNALSNSLYNNSYLSYKAESSRDMKKDKLINNSMLNVMLDIGATVKAGKGILGIGFQYAYALSNSLNADKRYDNIEYTLANQWVDSDVKINYMNIYASYSFPLLWRVYK